MIKLRHYSNLFIAPVFLLLALTTQSTPTTASTAPIKINDAEDLGKIGRDRDYPLDGTYQQTADIVVTKDYQSIGNDTHPFTGEYYGQCRTISGLSNCFIDTLKGSIRHLHFTGANITSHKTTGLAACVVDDTGTVSNIWVKDIHILTNGRKSYAGIGGGLIKGTVGSTTAVNSNVTTRGWYGIAGIGGGLVYGTVGNTTAVNSRVETGDYRAHAGIGGGAVNGGGTVANTKAVNSRVETSGEDAHAGIGGGMVFGTVGNTTAVNSTVETGDYTANAGIGGGLVNFRGTVANTTAVNSHVTTGGDDANAGIGGGLVRPRGTVANTTAVNSHVTTRGWYAYAGIGGGLVRAKATVANTTAVNSYVNGIKENSEPTSNDQLLCQKADLHVLTANCSSRTEFLDALDFSNSNACPVNAATVSTGTKESAPTTASTAAKESTATAASTPIEINDARTLGKIALHPDYPINGTHQQNATAAPTTATSIPRKLCSSLRDQTTGVQQRLIEDSDLVSERQCVVLSADPADDLSELIQQIPDNTVILLSSKTTSPTVAPVTGKLTVEYFIANAIVLKNGQDIIGAADDGFEIVIKLHDNFTSKYMIGVGVHYDDEFNFGETADNHIKHITFQPTGVNPDTQTDAIVHTNCYNRTLSIENNVFYLPVRAAVNINCSANLDASTSNLHTGPGLRFADNHVIGQTIHTTKLSMIPEKAIFINLRNINNLSNKLEIIGNTFRGKISELAQIAIGSGSNINIFRNTVDIDNKGKTPDEIRTGIEGGFALKGLSSSAYRKAPLINLAGNNINVTRTALTIYDKLDLALACNHFMGMTLWKVDNEYFPLKAVDPLPLADECPRSVSSTVGMATTSAPTLCQIVNSWTPINDSKATALTGLTNVEGQFYFDSAVCMTELQSLASSADTTPVTNALGVIASLAILLNL
ncbi:hypothetical protein [Endozoicomonas sp. ALB122]|uniref:hypothetical protein n=1 Tax=Endozoicomonas sp. ALB122 TaxID=3403075 RepID=UPI003BB6B5E6